MSEMSSMLEIHPGRPRSLAQRAGIEGEQPSGDGSVPSGRSPFSFRLVVRGRVPVERDVKYAAHAAHAYDPSVLDACWRG